MPFSVGYRLGTISGRLVVKARLLDADLRRVIAQIARHRIVPIVGQHLHEFVAQADAAIPQQRPIPDNYLVVPVAEIVVPGGIETSQVERLGMRAVAGGPGVLRDRVVAPDHRFRHVIFCDEDRRLIAGIEASCPGDRRHHAHVRCWSKARALHQRRGVLRDALAGAGPSAIAADPACCAAPLDRVTCGRRRPVLASRAG